MMVGLAFWSSISDAYKLMDCGGDGIAVVEGLLCNKALRWGGDVDRVLRQHLTREMGYRSRDSRNQSDRKIDGKRRVIGG